MSSETKWTKGPWELIDSGVHPGIDGGDGSSVIIWGASLEETGVHGKSRQQALANAHLIAAAPEMYAELKTAHDNLYALITDPEIGHEVRKYFDLEDVAAMARPLAKARGETS